MRYRDIISEDDEIIPVIDPKKLAKAEADGFDTTRIWYHGTKRKFSSFRLPARAGINELGKGVYVTQYAGTANVWAQGNGHVLACVLRQGKMIEMSDLNYSAIWSSGPEADDRWASPLWREIYQGYCLMMKEYESSPGAGDAHSGYRDFAERMDRGGIKLADCLAPLGYIGATSRYSQIKGQAVIWNPADVRIVGGAPGVEGWVPSI